MCVAAALGGDTQQQHPRTRKAAHVPRQAEFRDWMGRGFAGSPRLSAAVRGCPHPDEEVRPLLQRPHLRGQPRVGATDTHTDTHGGCARLPLAVPAGKTHPTHPPNPTPPLPYPLLPTPTQWRAWLHVSSAKKVVGITIANPK